MVYSNDMLLICEAEMSIDLEFLEEVSTTTTDHFVTLSIHDDSDD